MLNKESQAGTTADSSTAAESTTSSQTITKPIVSSRFLSEPLSHASLVLLGYSHHPTCEYYCPPPPANGGTYRIELRATHFKGNEPVKGTEEWRAYLTDENLCTIRRFKTLGELNYFHKGMCGDWLFQNGY